MNPAPTPGAHLRRVVLSAVLGAVLALPAAALAAAVGSNHPSSGAYSPVNASSWGTASWPLGASFTAGPGSTLEVAVYSANATNMVLEIYTSDTGADAAYDYTMAKGSDNIWRAAVAGAPANTLYAFRAWGPNWPFSASWARGNSSAGFVSDCDSSGNRFNPNKVLFDPYARELSHNTETPAFVAAGESYNMYTSGGASISSSQTYSGPLSNGATVDARIVDDGHWAPKAVALSDSTSTGTKPAIPQKDAIIYEAHVRGITQHPESVNLASLLSPYSGFQDAASVPDSLRGTYAGAAYMAGYLKDLGFNTIELLPVHESDDATQPSTGPTSGGGGYWCYYTYGFFAPNRRYAHNQAFGGPTTEFKSMVAAFHAAGIEVYLDVVYNHTGEGGVWDSTGDQAELTFLRGLDNASYYTLKPGQANTYVNNSGIGNDVNGASAPAAQLILDSLAYWTNTMGIDGYRFDEGTVLGRTGTNDSYSSSAALLENIASFASTNNVKIIAEPWDSGGGYEVGGFPAGWGCWNGPFRDTVRLYLQGIVSTFNTASDGVGWADAFMGTQNLFSNEGGPQKSVNYIDCHDGYNMTDVVSYANAPTDLAWPFGPETSLGSNDNNASYGGNQALRRQIIRDGWAFMFMSRGVPMVLFGDEMGRTVNGNNNSYNIDSVATWNNYKALAVNNPNGIPTEDASGGSMPYDNNLGTFSNSYNANFAFLQYMLHLRAGHAGLRPGDYTTIPITFTNPDGTSFQEATTPSALIHVTGSAVGDDDFLVLSNLGTSAVTYTLPSGPAGTHWSRIVDTNSAYEANNNVWTLAAGATESGTLSVEAQSVVILESVKPVPAFTTQPVSVTAGGNTVALAAYASNAPTYQWYYNGAAIQGATDPVLIMANGSAGAGDYYCVATNASGVVASTHATVTLISTSNPGRLINLSCRAGAGTGQNVLTAGYVIGGAGTSGTLPVLVRASGPALAPFGLTGLLNDPELILTNVTGTPNVQVGTNTGWGGSTTIFNAASAVGAFSWGSKATADSALFEPSLSEGNYTAEVQGASGDTGLALVEVYDATPSGTYTTTAPRLTNLSTRIQLPTGTLPVYDGFVISGNTAMTVLIRATGPTLSEFGLTGLLADPQLILTNITATPNTVITTNTGWNADPSVIAAAKSVGAFSWGGSPTADSAILITLPPGNYTAGVVGASGDAGLVLVEVYEVP